MKPIFINLIIFVLSIYFSSCATIIGGSKFNADVTVSNDRNVKIIHQGREVGTGFARFQVNRKDADKFSFTLRKEGCKDQVYTFKSRTFRGWAFCGSLATWTFIINGVVPVPVGFIVDLATGAFWKPNVREPGVIKEDYKNFKYLITFDDCPDSMPKENILFKVIDLVYLKNGGIIKGRIIERIPNVQVKIETRDGSIFVFKFEEIEKIAREDVKDGF